LDRWPLALKALAEPFPSTEAPLFSAAAARTSQIADISVSHWRQDTSAARGCNDNEALHFLRFLLCGKAALAVPRGTTKAPRRDAEGLSRPSRLPPPHRVAYDDLRLSEIQLLAAPKPREGGPAPATRGVMRPRKPPSSLGIHELRHSQSQAPAPSQSPVAFARSLTPLVSHAACRCLPPGERMRMPPRGICHSADRSDPCAPPCTSPRSRSR